MVFPEKSQPKRSSETFDDRDLAAFFGKQREKSHFLRHFTRPSTEDVTLLRLLFSKLMIF